MNKRLIAILGTIAVVLSGVLIVLLINLRQDDGNDVIAAKENIEESREVNDDSKIQDKVDLTEYNEILLGLSKSNYTKESWEVYEEVLRDNVITSENTQKEIDAAVSAIKAAQDNLITIESEELNKADSTDEKATLALPNIEDNVSNSGIKALIEAKRFDSFITTLIENEKDIINVYEEYWAPEEEYRIHVMDLNFDGTPEIITTYPGGSDRNFHAEAYFYNSNEFTYGGTFDIRDFKPYHDKKHSKKVYIGHSLTRGGASYYEDYYFTLDTVNSQVIPKNLFLEIFMEGFSNDLNELEEAYTYYSYINGGEEIVIEDEYYESIENYFSQLEEINWRNNYIIKEDWHDMTYEEKYESLNTLCKEFYADVK